MQNGLKPSFRAFKGVGWNRALPAPFSFDNGIKPDGLNDYILIPGLSGTTLPSEGSLEIWGRTVTANSFNAFVEILNNNNAQLLFSNITNNSTPFNNFSVNGASVVANSPAQPVAGERYHFILRWSALNNITATINAGRASDNGGTTGAVGGFINTSNLVISAFKLFTNTTSGNTRWWKDFVADEFRFYSASLTSSEIDLNYNGRIGANPCNTEKLECWLKFERFETLDFSVLQDGSDMRLGVRDQSGKNRHAQPIGMETNTSNAAYCIIPF